MEELAPMDILRAPSKNARIVGRICQWIKTSHDDDENKISTIVFKKDTPKRILRLFERNSRRFRIITDYTINKHYEIEK